MYDYINNTYWIAVAHLHDCSNDRLNSFIVHIIHEDQLSLADFFT